MDGPQLRLILASASPRRRELLSRLGLTPDTIVATDIDETPAKGELPRDYARRMAREKALAILGDGAHVLAGDTVVACGRRILPKAEDEATEAAADTMREAAEGTATEAAVDAKADAMEHAGEEKKDAKEEAADAMDKAPG